MKLDAAIERHRKPLLRIVATMFAMAGLGDANAVERLSKPVYLAVLRLLRPAESAVRRLIVVAAQGLVVKPPLPRAAQGKPAVSRKGKGERRITFKLFDPRQHFGTSYRYPRHPMPLQRPGALPRIRVLDVGYDPRIPLFRNAAPASPPPESTPEPDDAVSALHLSRRLIAIKSALEDLTHQAKRYARWQARPPEKRRPKVASALRPGRPPGHRNNPIHKVDRILADCHWLARHPSQPNTS